MEFFVELFHPCVQSVKTRETIMDSTHTAGIGTCKNGEISFFVLSMKNRMKKIEIFGLNLKSFHVG